MNHEVILSAKHITRQFGSLIAVNDVSLDLPLGAIHAVIGTNGAGKSTLISILAGELAPNKGEIHLNRQDVTRWPQPRRARAGMGRSYQRITIFPSLSVHENCRIMAQANDQKFWSWTPAHRCARTNEIADRALAQTGLENMRDSIAASLSHGGKRQLEIAMSLATKPKVLLLDEPLAGMGPEETERILALLTSLKPDHAILLIEHDMDAVFRISDVITVMVNGTIIAHGDPAAIRRNRDVQIAYLGDSACFQ
uniref:ABC transporter ATP-binding protein n=1 Tax=Castellaniella defragrans TaxID=75697 RepID=UPI00333E5913